MAPRTSRKKAIVISSDDEDEPAKSTTGPLERDQDVEHAEPRKPVTGKLKPVKKKSKVHQITPFSTQKGSSQKSPQKAKASQNKGKAAAKEDTKTNGKTIFSFFNPATQRQRTPQLSASPEKPPAPVEETDAIHDDSDDNVKFTNGSSTALVLRKRKAQLGDGFDDAPGLSQSASQKFRKASSGDRIPSLSIINDDKRPWTEQFAPKDLSELAVHKKKVADVRQWLEMAFRGRRQRVLVLKGAAGTGKTTTLQLLAKDMGVRVMEWHNPVGVEVGSDSASTGAQFNEFLGRAGRSGGLQLVSNISATTALSTSQPEVTMPQDKREKSILLIEEFPNTFSRTSTTLQAFRSSIMQYLSLPTLPQDATPTPVVMIISETLLSTNTALADSFTAHRLLGPELSNHPFLDTIEFNAVAPTILSKALDTIVIKEARKSGRRRTPGPQVLKHIAESGDIRSAVSSLEFLCLRGDDGDTWSSKVSFGKQKASANTPLTKSEIDALKLISNRESTLGIFHAVGKVVYNKRIAAASTAHPPPWLPKHRRDKVPENDVDQMIDELGTDVSTFVAALHENYALSCGSTAGEESLDSLTGCIDSISDADLLSVDRFAFGTRAHSGSATDSFRQDEMAFQVAVRGILFALPHPVHRSVATAGRRADAHKMFYPASLKIWKKQQEVEGVLEFLIARFQAGGLADSLGAGRAKDAQAVESWKRNASAPLSDADGAESAGPLITTSMKSEMLIERLPYMAHILSSRSEPSPVIEQIATVTRIRGAAPIQADDDAELDDEENAATEQWATDKPDTEPVPAKKGKLKQVRAFSDSGGLPASTESRIEKLVLEDDDIEDF